MQNTNLAQSTLFEGCLSTVEGCRHVVQVKRILPRPTNILDPIV